MDSIVNVLVTAGISGLVVLFLDKAYSMILIKFFPDKYLLKFVKNIDDKYLDKFKAKYPVAGLEAEKKIAKALRDMANIIEDKG